MQPSEHSSVTIRDHCNKKQSPSLEGGSWAGQGSLPHNKVKH